MISKDYVNKFSKHLFEDLEPFCNSVMDREDIHAYCQGLIEELADLDEADVCQQRYDLMELTHVKPEEYVEKIVSLDDGREVWLGIRFFGLDKNFPFVEVQKYWRGISKDDFESIKSSVQKEYGNFNPKGVALYINLDDLEEVKSELTDKDMHYVIGKIDPEVSSILRFEKQSDMNCFEDYKRAYYEYFELRKGFRELLNVPEHYEEDFKEAFDAGHLYKLYKGEDYVGILAGTCDEFAGQKAFYINDEIIFKDFLGNGLGVEIQKGIHKLAAPEGMKYVSGTILEDNQPSLKTATRAGRSILFGKYFLLF